MKNITSLPKIVPLLFLLPVISICNAQTYLNENFNAGIPGTWTHTDVNCAPLTWIRTTTGFRGGGTYLKDGSEFIICDSDLRTCMTAATNTITSPSFDASAATTLKLQFDQYYRHTGSSRAYVDVYDGAAWQNVATYAATQGGWGASTNIPNIDITAYKNANMQVRFRYSNAWSWYWSIDNVKVYVPCNTGDWSGATNTDWFTATNWCNSTIPTSAINATIPVTSNNPIISGAAAVCNGLTINAGGAVLTINAGASLTASGATTNNGTFTIKADATGMGSFIDNGTLGGTGTFNMEQYLTGAGGGSPTGRGWYIGSPVASATSNVYKGAGGYKLWSYSEPTQAYTEITDLITPLNPMEGYVARSGGNSTVTFTGGAFNTGNFTNASMTHKPSAISHEGYTLIGNPYPSSLDWDLAIAASTNLSTTIWYRSYNGTAMVFDTYNSTGGVGTNNNGSGAVTQYIPPTQAVWVEAPTQSVTGTLNFTNAMRSNQPTGRLLKKSTDTDANVVRLMIDDGNTSDETVIYFNKDAKDIYDNFDSHKIFSDTTLPQLYTTIGKDTLVINGLNGVATNPVIDLGVKFPATGNYAINAKSFNFRVTLEDKQLNVFQNLTQDSIYKFSATQGNIANRFALHFQDVTGVANTSSIASKNIKIYQANGTVVVDLNGYEEPQGIITVSDILGRKIATQKITAKTNLLDLHSVAGMYVIQVQTSDKIVTKKMVID